MPHFRQEGKGELWATGRGIRWQVPHGQRSMLAGVAGFAGMGKGPRSRRSGLQDGRSADAEAATPFPAEPRAGPEYARRPPTTADGTAWLYRRSRRAYTRPPSQSASAGGLVCERDLPREGYQAKVPAHIPQKGLITPGSCLSAVRWEKIPVIQLLGPISTGVDRRYAPAEATVVIGKRAFALLRRLDI